MAYRAAPRKLETTRRRRQSVTHTPAPTGPLGLPTIRLPAPVQRQGPPITPTRAGSNQEHRLTIRAPANRRPAGVTTTPIPAPPPTCKEPVIRTQANTLITTTSVGSEWGPTINT